jgi:hypothetical protein
MRHTAGELLSNLFKKDTVVVDPGVPGSTP